jgi:hypothetical protein
MIGWTKQWKLAARLLMTGAVLGVVVVAACGGFCCQNNPVDQVGERIVFSVNADAKITSLIEIQYTGTADDFSWILPIPADGDLVFDELHSLTDVRFIAPAEPECMEDIVFAVSIDDDGGVEVFANDDMPIWVWIIADDQAVPSNYEHMEIDTAELTFFPGGNNYQRLVGGRADAMGGRAFITEFAGPIDSRDLVHPYLRAPQHQGRYLSRLATVISPLEMTADPTFSISIGLPDVSNVRDASEMAGLYDCERNDGDGGYGG